MAEFAYLDAPTPLALAHRGGRVPGRGAAIENSMAAFQHAIDLGYRYLETDVHATADGVLVAFHDASLDRVTDRSGRIEQLPYSEVARARIGGTEPIPLLAQILDAWPHARLNIDVKAPGAIEPLVGVLRQASAMDRVCVGSFSDSRLALVRAALGPGVCTSLGPRAALALRLNSLSRLWPSRWVGRFPCVQVPESFRGARVVDERLLTTAHRLGLQVHVWTVNDAARMRALLDLGVDGIITDETDLLKQVLLERGAWNG